MTSIRALCITVSFVLTSCSTATHHRTPSWTLAPPESSFAGLRVTGLSYPSPSERSARESALESALTEFLRFTGMEVSSYIQMTTRETAEKNHPGQVAMDNTEDITLATQGFVQKVRQQEWHLRKDEKGMKVAYVRILVPASEVARVESEQVAMLQAKRGPYENARRQFSQALIEHRLTDAAQMVGDLVVLAKQAERSAVTREQLIAEIKNGLAIAPLGSTEYNLDTDIKAQLSIRATHKGCPVVGLPLEVTVPSGITIKTGTGADGIAKVVLPSPSRAGEYPLVVRTTIQGVLDLSRTTSYQVTGTKERLSDGQFHSFVEVQSAGSADIQNGNRYQAEQMALQTARQLAFASLLQKRQGLNMQTQISIDGGTMTRSLVRSESAGHVNAQAVEENVTWKNSRPVATVVYRMSLQ